MSQQDNIRYTRAEINLDALRFNIRMIRKAVPQSALISAVIKADGYGHGAVEIAQVLQENGADCFSVAIVDEGIELRKAGVTIPILVLGHTSWLRAKEVLFYNLEQCIYNLKDAEGFSNEAVRQNRSIKIHIKINSGMNRIGYTPGSDALSEIIQIAKLPNIILEGIFTHFCTSDASDQTFTEFQLDRFETFWSVLKTKGISFSLKHCNNSAAIVHFPDYSFDMVRAGILLYGQKPSTSMRMGDIVYMPVMSFKTRIIQIKTIQPGESVGYGRSYIATTARKIATLPVGYADGYPRQLSGKAEVLLHHQRAKLIGNICMDMCMIDVSDIDNVNIGDEVVLFGNQDNELLPVDELAEILGTINYEIICRISRRVPRLYVDKERVVHIKNYLAD